MGGFQWSYSKVKNFETCPKRHYHYDIAKDVKEPTTSQLDYGNDLHACFAERLSKNAPLPLGFGQFEPLMSKIAAGPGKIYVEQKLAITSSFTPSTYFGKDVWFRTIVDCARVTDDRAAIFDWKTGKVAEDPTQLKLMAATVFAHMPKLVEVRSALVFVAHDAIKPATFTRNDLPKIWAELLPRVKRMVEAQQTNDYPPKPGGLCKKYCAVVSCPFHGKGSR
jgi:PD-(D/E)XK nuclease superfamily